MGSSKGGQSETTVKLPKELQQASVDNLADARRAASIGYVPNSGPSVAAFTPQQITAFDGANQASQAFGIGGSKLGIAAGLPTPQTFAGGINGYSAKPLYDQEVAGIPKGQLAAIMSFFMNPKTGAMPGAAQASAAPAQARPNVTGYSDSTGWHNTGKWW